MRYFLLLTLSLLCCAARAEFPPDDDVNAAVDASREDQDADRDNPFSGTPEEMPDQQRRLNPRTNLKKKKKEKEKAARKARKAEERDPDSADDDGDTEDEVEVPRRDAAVIRLGLYGGYTHLLSGDSNIDSARGNQGLSTTFPLGLQMDVRAWRYLGLDFDGYYSIAPMQTVVSGSSGTTTSDQKQIQVAGGSILARAIYPIENGQTRWYPSVGLGYGYHLLKHVDTSASTTVVDQMTVNGMIMGGGITLEVGRDWIFNLDFHTALGAAGDVNEAGGSSPFDNPGNGSFMRGRFSAAYRVGSGLYLGATLLYRSMQVTYNGLTPGGSGTGGTSGSGGTGGTSTASNATQPTGAPESQLSLVATAQYWF